MDHETPHGDRGRASDDPGPPLPELTALREPPPAGFLPRLLRRLQRREAAGQVVEFSLAVLLRTWWSYLGMLFTWSGSRTEPGREEPSDE